MGDMIRRTRSTPETKQKEFKELMRGDFIDSSPKPYEPKYPQMSKEEFEEGKKEVMAANGLDNLFKSTLSDMEKIHKGQKK